MSTTLLWAAAAACLLATLAFQLRALRMRLALPADEAEDWDQTAAGSLPAAIQFAAMIGTFGFAFFAFYQLRNALGPWGQAAVAIGFGAVLFGIGWLNPRSTGRQSRWGAFSVDIAVPAIFAWSIYDQLRGPVDPAHRVNTMPFFLIGLIIVVLLIAYRLVVYWRDEDKLYEWFGGTGGYLPRRTFTPRARAILYILLLLAVIALFGSLYFGLIFGRTGG